MMTFVLIGGGLFFVATSVVGVRLLVLARRNRTQPELALGLAFLVGGTIGGALGQYVQLDPHGLAPDLLGKMMFGYCVVGVLGMGLYNVFTWRVFRPRTPWAAGLVTAIFISGLALIAWYAAMGVFETGVQLSLHRGVMTAANGIGPIWATVEGFRYYQSMRKRVRLGIADPIVTNRFFLWSLGSLCASLIIIGGIPAAFLDRSHPVVLLSMLSTGVLGTLASIAYALAFFPPRAYLERLRGAQAGAAAP